jgi:hypothetical protein
MTNHPRFFVSPRFDLKPFVYIGFTFKAYPSVNLTGLIKIAVEIEANG